MIPAPPSVTRRRATAVVAASAACIVCACAVTDPNPRGAPDAPAGERGRGELLLVTGATGRTGRPVVAAALARGYRVRALVRDVAAARAALGEAVELVGGDLRDPSILPAALRGVRRVVFAAGAGTLDENDPNGPRAVDFEAVRHAAVAAHEAHVAQFVLVSSQNVTNPDQYGLPPMRPLLRWKIRGEDALRASGVPYTIVRPGQLLDGPGGEVLAFAQGDTLKGPMSRADLALVCVEALGRRVALDRTFEVAGRRQQGPSDFDALFAALRRD